MAVSAEEKDEAGFRRQGVTEGAVAVLDRAVSRPRGEGHSGWGNMGKEP